MGLGLMYKQLKEITTKIGSGATPRGGKEAYKQSGIALIRSQNVLDFSFSLNGLAYIDEKQASQLNNVEIFENDILLNITGDSVARTCIVPDHVLPARINQHVMIIRVDNEKANTQYIFYYLQYLKRQLLQLASGGATRNALTKTMVENLEIYIPEKNIQDSIANILSSLDDKIENNNAIIANLEEQAQTIFKSWFVNFEPFQDSNFVESELGIIPKGWKSQIAKNWFTINIGKTPPRKQPEWFTINTEDVKWLSISNMANVQVFINETTEYLTKEAIEKFNVKVVPERSVLLSFKLTVGRVAIAREEMTTNEAIAHFHINQDFELYYLYLFLKVFDYNKLGNTSSIGNAVNSAIIKNMLILRPSDDALNKFHTVVEPLFEMIYEKLKENTKLREIRDTLLPKLMSGEIRIGNVITEE